MWLSTDLSTGKVHARRCLDRKELDHAASRSKGAGEALAHLAAHAGTVAVARVAGRDISRLAVASSIDLPTWRLTNRPMFTPARSAPSMRRHWKGVSMAVAERIARALGVSRIGVGKALGHCHAGSVAFGMHEPRRRRAGRRRVVEIQRHEQPEKRPPPPLFCERENRLEAHLRSEVSPWPLRS